MQVSNYEIIIPFDDEVHYLLVNGLYIAMDMVDAAVGKAMLAGNPKALPEDERDRLLARGHLTDSPEIEREDLDIFAGLHRRLDAERSLGLYILPTYNCNFRCPYCYEKHRLSAGEEWLKKTMSREMVDAVFEAVDKEKARGVKVDGVGLYGGEPLLKENIELIRYISKKATEADLELDAVTNGYDLNHFIDILTEYKYKKLQITLDGVKEDNDRRRIYSGGGGSYEKILENIGLVLSKGINVDIRINVGPANLEKVHELPRIFVEKGFTKYPQFGYYFAPTDGENYPGKGHGVMCSDLVDMLMRNGFEKKDAMDHVSIYSTVYGMIRSLIKNKEYFYPSDAFCGSESNMIMVDPEGSLYSCWDFVAMDQMRVGRINVEKGKFAFNFELLKWNTRTVDRMPECAKCPYVFACRGGCAAGAYREKGDFTSYYCGEHKDIFREATKEVCQELYNETGERELTRSLKERITIYTPRERKDLLISRDPKRLTELLNKSI
ncbi:MAG: radical SAM protein [Lachnospiraceae bacterium]|nr:radical SAM protein [Lachnospiraceae bacterium]